MGHSPALIHVHVLSKGSNVHSDRERDLMESYDADKVIVLDQGSRPGPPLVASKGHPRVLIVDHHMSVEVPFTTSVCRS